MQVIKETNFQLPKQAAFYRGKVRDVYTLDDGRLVMVASDRISAFDHVLPRAIPYKGAVLNQIACYFLEATRDICPNWLIACPDANVAVGSACEPIRVEMVIRGYLVGHAWRTYKSGERMLCGVQMPNDMQENAAFSAPIITPSTKAEAGHDEDISKEAILKQSLVSAKDYALMESYTQALFKRGTEMAAKQGLILADTKYEFGKKDGQVVLMDEIHTPDSSRYFIKEGYEKRLAKGEHQKQLSKEFVREWLMEQGFQGKDGQTMPIMPDDFVKQTSERYIDLYEILTGERFYRSKAKNFEARAKKNVLKFLKS